jgi:protein disulfide-isomerase A6
MKSLNYIIGLVLLAFGAKAAYEGENITVLNSKNFKEEVMDIASVNVVVFYNKEGANERLSKEIVTVSDKLRGFIKVGAVNCDDEENEALCDTEEVTEHPQINVYHPAPADSKGVIKKARVVYGGLKKAKYIAEYATNNVVSLVAPITAGETVTNSKINYNSFLGVKTYPKLILCTDKPDTPLLFRALSLEYFGKLLLGEIVHTETELLEKLNVTNFPTIFYFEAGSDVPIKFEGKGNHDGIAAFIAEREKISKESAEKAKEDEKQEKQKLFDPMPEEIKTQEDLLKCINGYGVCAISILSYEPDFEESVKQHESEIEILKNLKEKNKKIGGPFKYVWINSVEHGKKFIKDFDVPDMLPVFMIVNGKKKVYRVDRGAFDEESINGFLKDVRMGRGRFFSYKFEPQLDNDEKVKDEL